MSIATENRVTQIASILASTNRLDRMVDDVRDHTLGPENAPITLVEYGSYACPHCRAANERITEVRRQMGERLRYVFRHRPLTGNDLARRAADLVECASDQEHFWNAHVMLMTRSTALTADDLQAVSEVLGMSKLDIEATREAIVHAREHVQLDIESAQASGVRFTPTFFINGRRYDGPWDENSFTDAMLGSLGHRVSTAALTFASWAPSAGVLMLLPRYWPSHLLIQGSVLTSTHSGKVISGFPSEELVFECRC